MLTCSHHITEAAIKACIYMDETGHISNFLDTMEKGGSGIYTQVATGLNETKKGGETSKSKILKKGNIRIANMHKKYRRQDRDPGWLGLYRLGDVVTSVLPLGRYTNTSPILLQRYPLRLIIDST